MFDAWSDPWILFADVLRALIIVSGGYLAGQCVFRATETSNPAIRHRVIGLGLLGLGLALGVCFRFHASFNPGLILTLVGLCWSVYGMNMSRPGDKAAPQDNQPVI